MKKIKLLLAILALLVPIAVSAQSKKSFERAMKEPRSFGKAYFLCKDSRGGVKASLRIAPVSKPSPSVPVDRQSGKPTGFGLRTSPSLKRLIQVAAVAILRTRK